MEKSPVMPWLPQFWTCSLAGGCPALVFAGPLAGGFRAHKWPRAPSSLGVGSKLSGVDAHSRAPVADFMLPQRKRRWQAVYCGQTLGIFPCRKKRMGKRGPIGCWF